eukprot:NODE_95_length_1326_cov_285.457190_g92_i0.p2 GENE.NODE_95_length_1326_cov_285.457190_g92_i0~~NODE_95_length_1326_cov_285.457190_g92_i0.p2  ORF type:complete len:204 (+),score=19.18 NODE_95_length_1326_cov_285.457190_g92_i0:130-741(+)
MLWEKLILAARILVTVENPADVCAISARPYGQRAVLKFAQYTSAQYIAGRFTPGVFTNQIQEKFMQPRVLVITDPRTDHQAVTESSYVNIPVIAFADTDSPLKFIDCAIPCNNRGRQAIGMMYWFLTREVLRMRTVLSHQLRWEVKVDLYFYRDPEAEARKAEEEEQGEATAPAVFDAAPVQQQAQWGDENAGWDQAVVDWGS